MEDRGGGSEEEGTKDVKTAKKNKEKKTTPLVGGMVEVGKKVLDDETRRKVRIKYWV